MYVCIKARTISCSGIGRRRSQCSSSQLWYDFDHLVDINELHPSLQVFLVVVPNELRLLASAEERTCALVRLLHDPVCSPHAKLRLEYAKLPSIQWVVISAGRFFRNIKLETGQVEANWLTNRFDVSLFEC